jgi:energy-coupling factor transporter ATP-binding protein EcfA2
MRKGVSPLLASRTEGSEEDPVKKQPGTMVHKLDLHVHTPASDDYSDKNVTAKDILHAAMQRELQAIAITDHNTIGWVERLRKAARTEDIVVFPGFELNANGGHLLAIFDPLIAMPVLETVLIECGIPKQHWGSEAFVGCDIETALQVISSNGGLAIGAHAEKGKGFLAAITQGATRQKVFNNEHLSAIEALDLTELKELLRSSGKAFSRKVAILENSDAHSLSQIGSRFTKIRLDHLSIEGLRQAFIDPDVRVRLASSPEQATFPFIESICVDHGFLRGQGITFNTGLNCLIGGAGTGKSTIIEFLRFVLDQISSIEAMSSDCYGKLADLAGSGAILKAVIVLDSEERYEVSRVYDNVGNPFMVTRVADGKRMEISDLRKFFPVQGFSQGEVISICRNPLAQLELVDRHLELSTFLSEINKAEKLLDKQAAQIVKEEGAVSIKSEIEVELADLKTNMEILSTEMNGLKEAKSNKALLSHSLWQEEEAYWQSVEESIATTRESIHESIEGMELDLLQVPVPDEKTPSKALIIRNQAKMILIEKARERALNIMLEALSQVELTIEKNRKLWNAAFRRHTAEYSRVSAEKKTERLREVTQEIGKARNRVQALRKQIVGIAVTERHLKKVQKERARLLKTIADNRARIRVLREKKAKEIVKQTSERISLKYLADANRVNYENLVTTLLRGTHAQRPTIVAITENILPTDLVRLARDNDYRRIDSVSDVTEKWAQVVVEKLLENPNMMYQLEAVPLEDRLEISLRVSETEYKKLDKLSTGQKATVIVLLTMVEGNTPVIFDQPEDALYTPFIYSDIVKTLRNGKEKRQFILATHNPNIAIGADVDLGIILEGTSSQTAVQSAGGLDDNDTRGLLLLHLEGGEKAFKARHLKFGIK